jgi:hypothetical protein
MYRSTFLDLDTSCSSVVSFTPLPFYLRGKSPPVPIGQEVGWTPEPVWTTWRSENFLPHRDSNSDTCIVQSAANRYTDCATTPHSVAKSYLNLDKHVVWPPLWSSGQSSRLQIRRPGFDSRHYQIFWRKKKRKKTVVSLERGPLSLVSTTEELLDRKVAAPV